MLMIRNQQVKAFEIGAKKFFENEMVRHIEQFTPVSFKVIGEQGVRMVVKLGIERARKYGLTNRGPVRFYIEMMFMFGSDFDTDPQYPWVRQIFTSPDKGHQMWRADRLYDKAMDYVENVVGHENRYEMEALQRLILMRVEDIFSARQDIAAILITMHPHKCEYIAQNSLNALIQMGKAKYQTYSTSSMMGEALFVGLMFIFGSGCFTDLQFPWIANTLNNPSIDDPDKRLKRLYSKTITYMKQALINMKKR